MIYLSDLNKEELEQLISDSTSLSNVLTKLGKGNVSSKNMNCLLTKITEFGITPKFKKNRKTSKKELKDYLCEGTTITSTIKQRLIDSGILENKCARCGNPPEWCGEKLVLQLDHINGNHYDNRLENLRLLCPNCHSQTETFSRGLKEKKIKEIKKVEKYIPTKEELQKISSISEMARVYHMSKQHIRELLKKYGIYECTYSKKDYDKIVDVYLSDDNLTLKDTAKILNCDVNTVKRALQIKNIKTHSHLKKIYQYTINGEIINKFENITDASKWLIDNNITKNNKCCNKIVDCCKGKRKNAYGYIWTYDK